MIQKLVKFVKDNLTYIDYSSVEVLNGKYWMICTEDSSITITDKAVIFSDRVNLNMDGGTRLEFVSSDWFVFNPRVVFKREDFYQINAFLFNLLKMYAETLDELY